MLREPRRAATTTAASVEPSIILQEENRLRRDRRTSSTVQCEMHAEHLSSADFCENPDLQRVVVRSDADPDAIPLITIVLACTQRCRLAQLLLLVGVINAGRAGSFFMTVF